MPKTARFQVTRDLTYATRRLVAGEEFEAPWRDRVRLLATRKVRELRGDVPPPPATAGKVVVEQSLGEVRDEYERKMGKRPYYGWDVAELRRRMDA